jgi:hypothetical protein
MESVIKTRKLFLIGQEQFDSLRRSHLIGQNLNLSPLTSLIAGVTIVLMKEPALMEKCNTVFFDWSRTI